jgi:hypothetical protein
MMNIFFFCKNGNNSVNLSQKWIFYRKKIILDYLIDLLNQISFIVSLFSSDVNRPGESKS